MELICLGKGELRNWQRLKDCCHFALWTPSPPQQMLILKTTIKAKLPSLLVLRNKKKIKFKGAVSQWFCCFRSFLCWNDYFEALIWNKMLWQISNEFYQRELAIINFLRIFGTRGIKIRKNWPIFFKFQSISIHAIRSDRRQETVSVPSNSLQ